MGMCSTSCILLSNLVSYIVKHWQKTVVDMNRPWQCALWPYLCMRSGTSVCLAQQCCCQRLMEHLIPLHDDHAFPSPHTPIVVFTLKLVRTLVSGGCDCASVASPSFGQGTSKPAPAAFPAWFFKTCRVKVTLPCLQHCNAALPKLPGQSAAQLWQIPA